MKFERRSMTTWLLIGSSLSVRAVPLDLPRTALLRMAGDGQSLGNDPDILQKGRDRISFVMPNTQTSCQL